MVSREDLSAVFEDIGCVVTDKTVFEKCVELCNKYNVEVEKFVEQWVEFNVAKSSTKFQPTIEELDLMENELLKGKSEGIGKDVETLEKQITASTSQSAIEFTVDDIDALFSDYGLDKQKASRAKRVRSPTLDIERKDVKVRAVEDRQSPIGTPKRERSLVPKSQFGRRTHDATTTSDLQIEKFQKPHVPRDALYMFDILSKPLRSLTENCQTLGEKLCELWHEKDKSSTIRYVPNVRYTNKMKYRTFGRICIVQSKQSSSRKILLQGTKRVPGMRVAPVVILDLNAVRQYSIFPGQIVAVEGIVRNENVFVASQIFAEGYSSLPPVPSLTKDLRIYVAAGPYTSYHSTSYLPLLNLLECVKTEAPDVLILIGPIVHAKHSDLLKQHDFTFQEIFDQTISRVLKELDGTSTHVAFVSSYRDAHHEPVYPTMEYIVPDSLSANFGTKFSVFPDPSVITLGNLLVGVTTVDTIKDLAHSEVTNIPPKERLPRLAKHVLTQAAFYPMYPAATPGLNIDLNNSYKYGTFDPQPHIIILPSELKQFSKVINGCLIVNPGRLFKGTLAKIQVPAVTNKAWRIESAACEVEKFF